MYRYTTYLILASLSLFTIQNIALGETKKVVQSSSGNPEVDNTRILAAGNWQAKNDETIIDLAGNVRFVLVCLTQEKKPDKITLTGSNGLSDISKVWTYPGFVES